MKRLLLLLPLLLTPAAQAVDYVKCEAMNKAYGRLMARKDQAQLEAEKAVREAACGNKMDAQIENDIKGNDIKGNDAPIKRYRACMREGAYRPAAIAAGEAAMAEVQIRIDKVKADYEAEGCF